MDFEYDDDVDMDSPAHMDLDLEALLNKWGVSELLKTCKGQSYSLTLKRQVMSRSIDRLSPMRYACPYHAA